MTVVTDAIFFDLDDTLTDPKIGICGTNEGGKWRNEMQALIDAETPSGDRRARMIAGFNRGYNGFQQTYRTCTPAAAVAIRRYIEEGSKISRDLTARYAN